MRMFGLSLLLTLSSISFQMLPSHLRQDGKWPLTVPAHRLCGMRSWAALSHHPLESKKASYVRFLSIFIPQSGSNHAFAKHKGLQRLTAWKYNRIFGNINSANGRKNKCQALHQTGAIWDNKTVLHWASQFECWLASYSIYPRPSFQLFCDSRSKNLIKRDPHHNCFSSILSKHSKLQSTLKKNDWCRTLSSGHSLPVQSTLTLNGLTHPGTAAFAKPGRQTTPAKHNMTSTVKLSQWENNVFPCFSNKTANGCGSPWCERVVKQKNKNWLFESLSASDVKRNLIDAK